MTTKPTAGRLTAGTHVNSEGERVSIARSEKAGCMCLVVHDDPPPLGSGRIAPMMLDTGTVEWLRERVAPGYADLLAACKEATGALGMHGPCDNNNFPDCRIAWNMLRAAIKLAEATE